MLKKLYILGICLAFMSCNSWLTIEPKDQISEEDLFSRPEGFYNQLSGVYKAMASSDMYGKELSWGLLDVLAQYYTTSYTSDAAYKEAAKYDYEYGRTKSIIDKFWTDGYNIIANCNVLIKNTLQTSPSMFPQEEREHHLILGEAYALRALMHFDLLRLFAPSLKVNSQAKILPYVTEFPTHFPTKTTSTVFIDSVISDLNKAEELVKEYDYNKSDLVKDLKTRLELMSNDENRFLEFRGYRLNYWAIKCLKARVYLYKGDEKNALACAKELITLHENEGWCEFSSRGDVEYESNIKYYDDVYFALYNNNLSSYSEEYLGNDKFLAMQDVDGLFNDMDKYYDYRYLAWEDHPIYEDVYPIPKRIKNLEQGKGEFCSKMIPMIRLSEMYYIAAEAIFDEDPYMAEEYIYRVMDGRGSTSAIANYQNKKEFIEKVILSDLRREVYGEGQLFFFYKRHNLPVILKDNQTKELTDEFVLPTPEKDEQANM